MATLQILMIGNDGALKSPRAQEIKTLLMKGDGAKVWCASGPEDLAKIGALRQQFKFWIFFASGAQVPNYPLWKQYFSKIKESKPLVAIVSDRILPSSVAATFSLVCQLVGKDAAAPFCLKVLNYKAAPANPASMTNRADTLSHTKMDTSALVDPLGQPAPNHLDELVAGLDQEARAQQAVVSEANVGSDANAVNMNDLLAPESVGSVFDSDQKTGEVKEHVTQVAGAKPRPPSAHPSAMQKPATDAEALFQLGNFDGAEPNVASEAPAEVDEFASLVEPVDVASLQEDIGTVAVARLAGDLNSPGLKDEFSEGLNNHAPVHNPQNDIGTQVALPKESKARLTEAAPMGFGLPSAFIDSTSEVNIKRAVEGSLNEPSISLGSGAPSEEIEILKRYAALKEREAREREATIQVLNKQLSQVKEKMLRSEGERRRVMVDLNEAEVSVRALQEQRDQHQHQMRKLESQLQERQKGIQVKLDNAQFSSTRAEKKLEEFRDRVRNDILRIRLRERELSNKLELQKRDAEALLSSKDERLLEQKREIDRLEYEMELLKERMIDDTSRAEERAAKLSRALQSLKMAQGVLTGIEEEVIPTSEAMKDDSDNEAA